MNLTQARKVFERERVPFTFDGAELEVLEPSLAVRISLAREVGLAADLPLVSATVVLPGTEELVFPTATAVLASSGSKSSRLIEQVKAICERWKPAPAPAIAEPRTTVDTTPMEVPESAKAAAAALPVQAPAIALPE